MGVRVDAGDVAHPEDVEHPARVDRAPQVGEGRPESEIEPIHARPALHLLLGERGHHMNRRIPAGVHKAVELDKARVLPHLPLPLGHRGQPPGHCVAVDHRIVDRIEPVDLHLPGGSGRVPKQDVNDGRGFAAGRGECPEPPPALVGYRAHLLPQDLHIAVVLVVVHERATGALPPLACIRARGRFEQHRTG